MCVCVCVCENTPWGVCLFPKPIRKSQCYVVTFKMVPGDNAGAAEKEMITFGPSSQPARLSGCVRPCPMWHPIPYTVHYLSKLVH